jgi:ABC-2 type transport system permease protein
MNKFIVLLQQNYMQKLKTKTFIFSTLLYIVIMLGLAFFDDIKELFTSGKEDATVVVVYNETNSAMIEQWQLGEDYELQFVNDKQMVEKEVKENENQIGIVFSEKENTLAAQIFSAEPLKLGDQTFYEEQLANLSTNYAFEKIQLSPEEQAIIANAYPSIEMIPLNDESSKTAEEKQAGMFGSYFVGILIYIFVIGYLSIITTDVASEKGSRALEMLLVSIKPETHFKAKVFSTLLVAFTQFAIMLVAGITIIIVKGQGEILDMVSELAGELDASYIIYVIFFLLLTLVLYLVIGALFGSLVSKVEEASQVMMPAMLFVIVAFYVMVTALNNPDSMLVKVFSYIPFTSGMVMPMRLGGSDIAMMEPLLSLLLLVATVAGLYKFSLVYYKRSVLTYSSGGVITKLRQLFKVSN